MTINSIDNKKKTKRKVNLTSSHSDNERDEGPLSDPSQKVSAVSELYEKTEKGYPHSCAISQEKANN